MGYRFLELALTPGVAAAQAANGSAELYRDFRGHRDFDRFTAAEVDFIGARASFYMATVSEAGWPYVQHRGGPPGFVRVLDERTLACPDYRGNRQYISVGNLATQDRACLFFMDYPHRRRLKIFVTAQLRGRDEDPSLFDRLATAGYPAHVERAFVFRLAAFDWNCPQHITPRLTELEFAPLLEPLHQRIADLEARNRALVQRLAANRSR